jgi:hypothetical protein
VESSSPFGSGGAPISFTERNSAIMVPTSSASGPPHPPFGHPLPREGEGIPTEGAGRDGKLRVEALPPQRLSNGVGVFGAEAGGGVGGGVVAVRVGRGTDILHREEQCHHGGDEQRKRPPSPSWQCNCVWKEGPLTRAYRPDLSPQGEGALWRDHAPRPHLSLGGEVGLRSQSG